MNEFESKLSPGKPSTLPENVVHIWRAWLDVEGGELARLASHLSQDELARADRFVFPRDRDHFIAGRGRLREILGTYTQRDPKSLQFQNGRYGKPSLTDNADLRFNLTHSYGLALYGLAIRREVGIDTENIRPDFASEEIAERYFSAAENRELRELPPESRTKAFFLCWTRKEAYVKAHGDGLQIPLASFDVSLKPGEPATLRSDDCTRWSIRSFEPATGYEACILVEGRPSSMLFFNAGATLGESD